MKNHDQTKGAESSPDMKPRRRGRPREFDESLVLEKAMELFWFKGYHGVGMAELIHQMQISRQSLYNAYGNKRRLFIRSIEHYRDTRLAQALDILAEKERPLDSVRKVMRFFETLARDKSCRGCFVANSLVEMGPHDQEISEKLTGILELLQCAIHQALTNARKKGELSNLKPPRLLAKAITNSIIGMAVTGKLKVYNESIHDVYKGTLCILD